MARQPRHPQPIDGYAAGSGLVETCNYVDDGALAGTVGPDQAENFALAHFEAHAVDGLHAAEVLGERVELKHRTPPATARCAAAELRAPRPLRLRLSLGPAGVARLPDCASGAGPPPCGHPPNHPAAGSGPARSARRKAGCASRRGSAGPRPGTPG